MVHTPDEWAAVVARSVGALDATVDKGTLEFEQLCGVLAAVLDLQARLAATSDGFARIEAWSAGPGTAIHATSLTRMLRAHVTAAQKRAAAGPGPTHGRWHDDSMVVRAGGLVVARQDRHAQLGALATELRHHDASIAEWNREVAALRSQMGPQSGSGVATPKAGRPRKARPQRSEQQSRGRARRSG